MTIPVGSPNTQLVKSPESAIAVKVQVSAHVAELRERNAMVAAIRGTQWGKDCSPMVQRAVAHYCLQNGLDPVRHVEILGGRIYLTANFYDERGLPFILDGTVKMDEPDNVVNDLRLATLAKGSGEEAAWAKAESFRRTQERIRWGIPDEATGAFVTRGTVAGSPIVGFNWCGGGTKKKVGRGGTLYDADPIGDKDPTLTAQTRSRRRFWVQAVAALGPRAAQIQSVEGDAQAASAELQARIEGEVDPRQIEGPQHIESETVSSVPAEAIAPPVSDYDPYAESAPPVRAIPPYIAKLLTKKQPLTDEEAEDLRTWKLDQGA